MTSGTVRRATSDDAAELVRLRAVMMSGWSAGFADRGWQEACERVFRERLQPASEDFAAFVIDGTDGGLLSCGVGIVEQALPGPNNPSGRQGHISSMSTVPEARRQGHARAVFTALMEWYAGLGVTRVDLRATGMAEPLYRSFGFTDPRGGLWTFLRWQVAAPGSPKQAAPAERVC